MNTSGAVYQTWQHSSFTKSFTNRITTSSPRLLSTWNALHVSQPIICIQKIHVPQSRPCGKHNTPTACPCNQYHKRNKTQQGSSTSLLQQMLHSTGLGNSSCSWKSELITANGKLGHCNQIYYLLSKNGRKKQADMTATSLLLAQLSELFT